MKLDSVKVFLVSNPPPSFGGRYFVFLKLKTACGIEGVGEVYAATFGPKVLAAMIEDLFARRFAGRDPFQIESLWRESYGSGFTLRPDLSLAAVLSGLEMACWDIVGKAVEQPVYNLLGGKVHERLRSYTYLYPGRRRGRRFLPRCGPLGAARRRVCGARVHRAQIRSHRRLLRVRPSAAHSGSAGTHGALGAPGARSGGNSRRSAGGHPRPIHDLRRHPPGQAARALRSAVVRRAGAAGNAGADGHRGTRHQHSHRHR